MARAGNSTWCFGPAMLGLAAILSLGCASEPSAPTTGSIRVFVSTVGNPVDIDPYGYTVAIDDRPSLTLSPGGELTFGDVAAGSHLIRLGGFGANCSVIGSNPRSVEVSTTDDAGAGVRVAFVVSCVPKTGTIRVTTTTIGEDQDGDGYTVEIDSIGRGRVQANGTIIVEAVREGERLVSLGDVSPNCKVDGPYKAAANVAFGGTAQVALTVRCVPAGSLVVTTVVTGEDFPLSGYDLTVYQVDGGISTYLHVPTNASLAIPGTLAGGYRLFLTVPPNCVQTPPNPIVTVVVVGTSTAKVPDGSRSLAGLVKTRTSTSSTPTAPGQRGLRPPAEQISIRPGRRTEARSLLQASVTATSRSTRWARAGRSRSALRRIQHPTLARRGRPTAAESLSSVIATVTPRST